MEIREFVETLDREGRSLATAAEKAGVDAEVATCAGWQVRDLVRHTGMVHRWATAFVAEGHTSYHPDGGLPDLDHDELLIWFRDGHRRLVDTLAGASPDVRCWSFLPAPSPLAFWARRQAHETTVHRVDAESALGGEPTLVAPGLAVDGIDELLRGFHGRDRSKVRTEEPRVLRVRATDRTDAVWTVRLSSGPPVTERGDRANTETKSDAESDAGRSADVDCELTGPAAGLYLALWNRAPFPAVTGDASLATLWREKSAITWS
ncbi:maleylpyruvate isomerase family mycothiol-dependent enzyme [Streptomyces sp. NPDC026665]|uniref:maleylpyruvate isomerase family mycothiol-dependent enzyme n=1 Tax=Streptomyces sp. NPDC026665 TaxID=3154798 RepID=UPI0033CF5FFE